MKWVHPAFALLCGLAMMSATPAMAGGEPPPATLRQDEPIDFSPRPPEPQTRGPDARRAGGDEANDRDAAPPVRPRRRGLVLESTIGVLGFFGQFRHVAPPAYWMHAQLGYELTNWWMLFGEAELALTDTSEAEGASQRAFAMWGFGGGARASVHVTDRVGGFVQAEIGGLTAHLPHNALTYLGFHGAESIGLQAGGRVGVEWYPRDPHLAFSAQTGARYAAGFSKFGTSRDLPLMWDASLGFRYTF